MCMMPGGKIARSDSRERRLEKEREQHVEQKDIMAIKICSKFSVIDMEKKIIVISFIVYNPIGEFIFRIDILL